MFFDSLLARLMPRDGASTALEAPATGIEPPALMSGLQDDPGSATRRERSVDDAEDALVVAISAKVLHYWLQNQQQTLYPLTLNFRTLASESQATLARLLAIAFLAGHGKRDASDGRERGRAWLISVGADAGVVAEFNRAIDDPPALSRTLESAVTQDLAAYAYVVGLIASDVRSPASLRFLDYLEAYFDLPTALIRSATRKYRR